MELPSDYDAIVLGTGMPESIVAAALARNGLSVLHLDRYGYYSGDWSSFNFNALQEWVTSKQDPKSSELAANSYSESSIQGGEKCITLHVNSDTVRNITQKICVREEVNADEEKPEAKECANVSEKLETLSVSDTLKEPELIKSQDEVPEAKGTDLCSDTSEQKNEAAEAASEKNASGGQTDDDKAEASSIESSQNAEPCPSEVEKKDSKKNWVFSEIKKLWRKFNIDLMPKVLYCRGPMVELLISSDVAKYCEFKTVSRVLTSLKGKLEQVPCSRSDVFSSKLVSMIEKRMMMKYLTFCMEFEKHPEEYEGFEDQTYHEFLKSKKLTPNVQHFIQYSIAMVTDDVSTLKGLQATQMFLHSLGRYGNTAFLWPMYGSGELGQCFCRMCAVFGGVYCLKRTAQCLLVGEDNKCQAVIDTEGQRLNCKWLIAEASYLPSTLKSTANASYTSRAVLLTDRALQTENQEHITLMSHPVNGLESPVTILECPPSSGSCPADLYMVHLSCICKDGAEADLKPVMEEFFQCSSQESAEESENDETKPRILWALYFVIADSTTCTKADDAPSNVYMVGGPNHTMDFEYAINKAKEIFHEICPGDEFLPKAPNPEDIIWDDGAGNQPSESGFETGTSLDEEKNTEIKEDTSEQKECVDCSEHNTSFQDDSKVHTADSGDTLGKRGSEKLTDQGAVADTDETVDDNSKSST